MNVYKYNQNKIIVDNIFFSNGSIILLGEFEFFHNGHNTLLDRAKELRNNEKIGILIFQNKQKEVVQSLSNRLENLATLNFDFAIVVDFDYGFMSQGGDNFTNYLIENFNVKSFVVGQDFRYGKDRKWNIDDLKKIEKIKVEVLNLKNTHKNKISSSAIKELYKEGHINEINNLLVNSLMFDIEIKNQNKIIWESNIIQPTKGLYCIQIIIDDYWYYGTGIFHKNNEISFCLKNFKENHIYNQKTKMKIIEQIRLIHDDKEEEINIVDFAKATQIIENYNNNKIR